MLPIASGAVSGSNSLGRPEEQFRLLMENITDFAIVLLDAGGQVAAWNAGAERIFGYSRDEILGRSADCLCTPEDRARSLPWKLLKEAADTGRVHVDRCLVRKDGSPLLASGSIAALRDGQGHLRGYAWVCHEQKVGRAEDGGACRVLVVEDNRDAADSLSMLLKAWGQDVRVAHDGLQAIEVARDFHPEVVLLDIGLPGASGYEVAVWLRGEPPLDKALLVAVTAYGEEEDRRRSLKAGFDAHLVKPVSPDALNALLRKSRVSR